MTVAAYAVVGLGWPVLVGTLFDPPLRVGLAAISLFHGSFPLTFSRGFPRFIDNAFLWFPCWIAGETVVAVGLLLATLATFDRCLGRMKSFGRQASRRGKGTLRPHESLKAPGPVPPAKDVVKGTSLTHSGGEPDGPSGAFQQVPRSAGLGTGESGVGDDYASIGHG